ncbi:MAG: hypothetical protein VKL42_10275 [Snowella sp.]|nr:hypothetical protein [Snowella sp.]
MDKAKIRLQTIPRINAYLNIVSDALDHRLFFPKLSSLDKETYNAESYNA